MFFGGPRFRELIPEFISHHDMYSDDRRTTASNLRILARHLGELRLKEIALPQIESFLAARVQEGVGRSTLNRQRATLSRFFSWAIARGHHPGPNPVKAVQKFKEAPGRERFLTEVEAERLLLAAAGHIKPVIMAALHTGGRLGELLALRWADIRWDVPPHGLITFRKETTKSKRQRSVPISEDLAKCLRGLKRRQPDDRIFGFRGEGLRSIRTAFESARERAGLGELRFHDLRHTFASWFVQNEGDVYRLQNYLGHSTIKMTQRYAHLSETFLQEGVRHFGPPKQQSPTRQSEDPQV